MVKLNHPLISLDARGKLGKGISFLRRQRQNIVEKRPVVPDAGSDEQIGWRTMFQKCTLLWHGLSDAEKREWEIAGTLRHMTGYAWWQSQCLRPNPGIYLPLAGGTMSGEIDMDDNQIGGLVDPNSDDKAARKAYVDAQIVANLYTQGARVYKGANQLITSGLRTKQVFDQEVFDTDNCHHLLTNNERLTCRTAGLYLIGGYVLGEEAAGGYWYMILRYNGVTDIGIFVCKANDAVYPNSMVITQTYPLAVNDFVHLEVYQNSGGNLDTLAVGINRPVFWMQRIG